MEFTDYMLWKALVLLVIAFVWGIYCGINDLPLDPREWHGKGR
jgi:hypothetical protein